MTISKSDYMLFLKHPAWLWLKKYDKSKLPAIDENTQEMFDIGHEFEQYAEKLYPKALRIGFKGYEEYKTITVRTKQALETNVQTILQGGFEIEGLSCIIDILDKVKENTFDLVEIKSSAHSKPEHTYDLAFQTIVLEKCGLKIRDIFIIHVNNEYIRDGDINPKKITTKTDVTQDVRGLIEITVEQINKAKDLVIQSKTPDLSPRWVNQIKVVGTTWFSDWLEIYKHLNPQLDDYSIYSIAGPNPEQIGKLEDGGIKLIKDIPDVLTLRSTQFAQIKATKENERIIDKQKIKSFLNTFEYPLYFFDYETLSSAIPVFDGFQPYKDYPFQYSLHIKDSTESEIKHTEYLHAENSNPMPKLLEKLKSDIGDKGTVLTWNMSYEKECNDKMAKFYPEYKEFLKSLNLRINDLMIPFSEMWFVDKDFFGSASVKKVLPALLPKMDYDELNISDGLKARRIWTQTVLKDENQNDRVKIMKDLSEYCTLDTYAMVKILEELKKIVK